MSGTLPPGSKQQWLEFLARPSALLPCLIASLASLTCFGLPYLWDDFDFLGRAQGLHLHDLLPDPQIVFYRPLSREIYFGLVSLLGGSPLIGHSLNLLALIVVVCLLFSIVRRVAGPRAALLAALLFSALGTLPTLVGWVSGIQDVLAMAFLLAAIRAELNPPSKVGPVLFAAALLSKETSFVLLPVVLLAGSLGDGRQWPSRSTFVAYGLVCIAWAAIHPATRLLLAGGLGGGSGGYLGAPSLGRLENLWRAALTLLNIPLGPGSLDRFGPLILPLILALATVGLAYQGLRHGSNSNELTGRKPRVILISGLLLCLPLLLTCLFVQHWSPYYVAVASLGSSIAGGIWLAGLSPRAASLAICAYLCLGTWSRTAAVDPTVTTETNLRATGDALNAVEAGFKKLYPRFPKESHIYVSAQVSGPTGVYHLLYRYQPLRAWYREPSLFVLDPNRHRAGGSHDYLFWIDRAFAVFEIDPQTLAFRSSGPRPDLLAYHKTLRTFAQGRAAAGATDDAVRILLTMSGREPRVVIYDARMAAAILLAAGRESDARALLESHQSFDRVESLEAVMSMLAEPIPGLDLDDSAMRAFGLAPSDWDANHQLMMAFDQFGFGAAALRFATRTLSLRPDDSEASRVLEKWKRSAPKPGVTVPIPHD